MANQRNQKKQDNNPANRSVDRNPQGEQKQRTPGQGGATPGRQPERKNENIGGQTGRTNPQRDSGTPETPERDTEIPTGISEESGRITGEDTDRDEEETERNPQSINPGRTEKK